MSTVTQFDDGAEDEIGIKARSISQHPTPCVNLVRSYYRSGEHSQKCNSESKSVLPQTETFGKASSDSTLIRTSFSTAACCTDVAQDLHTLASSSARHLQAYLQMCEQQSGSRRNKDVTAKPSLSTLKASLSQVEDLAMVNMRISLQNAAIHERLRDLVWGRTLEVIFHFKKLSLQRFAMSKLRAHSVKHTRRDARKNKTSSAKSCGSLDASCSEVPNMSHTDLVPFLDTPWPSDIYVFLFGDFLRPVTFAVPLPSCKRVLGLKDAAPDGISLQDLPMNEACQRVCNSSSHNSRLRRARRSRSCITFELMRGALCCGRARVG